ncbi:MAG: SPOR domain-containing protein [Odoribacteraceae bacterium]|jgi:hypothetical protein|nr:SPOR domain-containing protein [Odoribacteraceae bacterium]
MKMYIVFLLMPLLLVACRRNNMKQKELTTAAVVRDTLVTDTIRAADTVTVVQAETPVATAPPVSKSVLASPSKRFHVIVASHPTRALAEKEIRRFREKGYPGAQIVFKDGVHYRVSIASFPTRKEALANLSFYARVLNVRKPWVTFY